MIETPTLEKVNAIIEDITNARRKIDDLIDEVKEETGWLPGYGPKPHRLRALQTKRDTLNTLAIELGKLWS